MIICVFYRSLVSTRAVKNYLSGLKTWSRLLCHDMSVFENNDIRLTLHGLTKIFNHTAKSKWPLTVSDLRKMITLLDVSQPLEACMWVFLTFFLLLLC